MGYSHLSDAWLPATGITLFTLLVLFNHFSSRLHVQCEIKPARTVRLTSLTVH